MNRRSFFKTLLGLASVAVVGLPKVEAAPVPSVVKVNEPVTDLKTFKVLKNRFTGIKQGEMNILVGGYDKGKSLFHLVARDRSKSYLCHRGFLYTYTHESYTRLLAQMNHVRRISKGRLGNCGMSRVYLAEKIVRIRDGRIFKDRYAAGMPENAATRQEWNELFGRIA